MVFNFLFLANIGIYIIKYIQYLKTLRIFIYFFLCFWVSNLCLLPSNICNIYKLLNFMFGTLTKQIPQNMLVKSLLYCSNTLLFKTYTETFLYNNDFEATIFNKSLMLLLNFICIAISNIMYFRCILVSSTELKYSRALKWNI